MGKRGVAIVRRRQQKQRSGNIWRSGSVHGEARLDVTKPLRCIAGSSGIMVGVQEGGPECRQRSVVYPVHFRALTVASEPLCGAAL